MDTFAESTVEGTALAWLQSAGWWIAHGPKIAPDIPGAARGDYGEPFLARRSRDALAKLNPGIPAEALANRAASLRPPGWGMLVHGNLNSVLYSHGECS